MCDRARYTIASALSSMIPNDLNCDRILNGLRRVVICLRITRAHVDRHSRKGTTQARTHICYTYTQTHKYKNKCWCWCKHTTVTAANNGNSKTKFKLKSGKIDRSTDQRHTVRTTTHTQRYTHSFWIEKEDENGTAKPMLEMCISHHGT